ncbi:solute carrier family 23 member 1-like [Mytilus trossulus]|uniref:solute carrier family 23 member 1-like n=1 Tax=Mytilus trossulus TaxID=6551 RepID=UPI0030050A95
MASENDLINDGVHKIDNGMITDSTETVPNYENTDKTEGLKTDETRMTIERTTDRCDSENKEASCLLHSNLREKKDSESTSVEIEDQSARLLYKVSDRPALQSTLFFAFQNTLLALPWNLTLVILVAEVTCARDDDELKARLLSTTILLSGLTTFVQVTFGVRMPVYQGPTTAYIIPLLAITNLEEWKCNSDHNSFLNNTGVNQSFSYLNNTKEHIRETIIYPRFAVLSGSLIAAGCIHAFLGLTGMVGYLMKFIGPITVIPTILLIALAVFKIMANFCAIHWGISSISVIISLITSLYLAGWRMPLPFWTSDRGFHIVRYPLQQVLSMLIAILVGWSIAAIFTAAGVLSNDKTQKQYEARTDARSHVIETTPWFYLPYPGQFGGIGFNSGIFVAYLTATFTSVVDSIADYYACAKMSHIPPPPVHAVNRGISVEGIMCAVSGIFGTGHGTTTFGSHIGCIGITRVASRFVYQVFALMLIICAIVGKFAAVFITIPYPVLGGVQVLGFGMFIGLIMSNVQYIDINSNRNLAIIGIAIMIGLMIPFWASNNVNSIKTGIQELDGFLEMVLSNPNLSGGFTACFLDNTVPGTLKERGLVGWATGGIDEECEEPTGDIEDSADVYEIPAITRLLEKISFTRFIPFSPTFRRRKEQ